MICITANGHKLDLEESFDHGKEGEIYLCGNSAIKVYKKEERTLAMEKKLKWMVQNPPHWQVRKLVAWPQELVYSESGEFLGFRMRRIKSKMTLAVILSQGRQDFGMKELATITKNFLRLVALLHSEKIVVADFNPNNSLVLKDGTVVQVDIDSCHIEHNSVYFPSNVVTPKYSAPEIARMVMLTKNKVSYIPRVRHSRQTDSFASAVMAFSLLMSYHPFTAILTDANAAPVISKFGEADNIVNNICPYFKKTEGYRLPKHAPPLSELPVYMRKLFVQCFVDGYSYPERRPTVKELYHGASVTAEYFETKEKEARKCISPKPDSMPVSMPIDRSKKEHKVLGRVTTLVLSVISLYGAYFFVTKQWGYTLEQLKIGRNPQVSIPIICLIGYVFVGWLISLPAGKIFQTKKSPKRKRWIKRICRAISPALALMIVTVGVTTAAAHFPLCYALTYEQYMVDESAREQLTKEARHTMSAEQKYAVGKLYQSGIVIPIDQYSRDIIKNPTVIKKSKRTAVRWYQSAFRSGSIRATAALGRCYCHGNGVEKDIEKAKRLLKKAADVGDSSAMYSLYREYAREGRQVLAQKYLTQAADAGHSKAKVILNMRTG